MVKVISAYNFQQQNTYAASGDIVGTCMIGTDLLAIGYRNLIEIQSLRRKNCVSTDRSNIHTNFASTLLRTEPCPIDQNDNFRQVKIAFPTIDEVNQLIYCSSKNYILTLESKTEIEQCQLKQQDRFVRAYTNFEIAKYDHFSVPIRARIASKTTPNAVDSNYIEVIEIPINGIKSGIPPHLIACCQISGSIVVCCNLQIHIFESCFRKTDITKVQFLDFIEAPFYVNLEFKPSKIALAEHVITCMDKSAVIAFKITGIEESREDSGTISNSLETDCSTTSSNNRINFSNLKFIETVDFELAKQFNQANGFKIISKIHSNWDHENTRRSSFAEDRPCLVNDFKVTLMGNDSPLNNDRCLYVIKFLIQLRLQSRNNDEETPAGEPEKKIGAHTAAKTTIVYDEFRCLALKPIYLKRNRKFNQPYKNNLVNMEPKHTGSSRHIMKSNLHQHCIGFSLFISTVSDGYVYQFTNQGKWYTENSKCLAIYPFTSPVIDIIIDNFVIHAITESGIETFSSRIGHKIFSSYFEYPMINDPYPEQTSPLVDVPICVMGICGFFGIKHVAYSSKNLVLLTTDNESTRRPLAEHNASISTTASRTIRKTGNWTIYDLELPNPETLVDDIYNLAHLYRFNSPDVYHELMEEAHVIIRLATEFLYSSSNFNNISDSEEYSDRVLEKLYIKTCKILADFTIRSPRKETYFQAAAYYSMCRYSILDIYASYHESHNIHGNSNGDRHLGLMNTLTLLMSRIGSNKSFTQLLSQTVPINCTCIGKSYACNAIKSVGHGEHMFAEELFELYMKYSPNDLTKIALTSPVFREILNDRICQLYCSLREVERLCPGQKICLVLCLCYKKDFVQALEVFETLRRSHLYTVLCENWSQLLFENLQPQNYHKCSFSDLTESILFVMEREELIEAVADVFIKILTVSHAVDLHFIIKLFMNYLAMNVGCPGYRNAQRIFEIVLQAYLYDCFKCKIQNTIMSPDKTQIQREIETFKTYDSLQMPSTDIGSRDCSGLVKNNESSVPYKSIQDKIISKVSGCLNNSYKMNFTHEDPVALATKLLFRMYLGLLKQYSTEQQTASGWVEAANTHTVLPNSNDYRVAFIEYLFRNKDFIKITNFQKNSGLSEHKFNINLKPVLPDYGPLSHEKNNILEDDYWQTNSFRRPIVFFELRKNFLNKMPPLCYKGGLNGVQLSGCWDEISLVVIKLQSLLNSGHLDGSLIEDGIAFMNSHPNMIGVDSFIAILLPICEGIEFFIHTNPSLLLDYAQGLDAKPSDWRALLENVLSKKCNLVADTQRAFVKLYDKVVEDILHHLVATTPLDYFLACIPEQIKKRHYNSVHKNIGERKREPIRSRTQDGINEANHFELMMREAVAKQRSDSLHVMIQSSGRQLNEAVNNFHLTFN